MKNKKAKYQYLYLMALYWPYEKHINGYDDILDGSALKAYTAFVDMLEETEKNSYMINSSYLLDDAAKESIAFNLVYKIYEKTHKVTYLSKSNVDRTFNVTIEKELRERKEIIVVPRIIYLDYKDSEIVELVNSRIILELAHNSTILDVTEVVSLYELISNTR
jgi:hypothetical protein